MPRESPYMAISAIVPHIRIDNSIIDEYLPKIGPYGYTIYSVIKRYFNQKTGDCYPSYKTIAKKSGIDRSTVIRYVKKLRDFKLISPEWRFKEDGVTHFEPIQFSWSAGKFSPVLRGHQKILIISPNRSRYTNLCAFRWWHKPPTRSR